MPGSGNGKKHALKGRSDILHLSARCQRVSQRFRLWTRISAISCCSDLKDLLRRRNTDIWLSLQPWFCFSGVRVEINSNSQSLVNFAGIAVVILFLTSFFRRHHPVNGVKQSEIPLPAEHRISLFLIYGNGSIERTSLDFRQLFGLGKRSNDIHVNEPVCHFIAYVSSSSTMAVLKSPWRRCASMAESMSLGGGKDRFGILRYIEYYVPCQGRIFLKELQNSLEIVFLQNNRILLQPFKPTFTIISVAHVDVGTSVYHLLYFLSCAVGIGKWGFPRLPGTRMYGKSIHGQ